VVKAMPEKPTRITCIGDSECTISSLDSANSSLGAYFGNRVCELQDYIKEWGEPLNLDTMEEMDITKNSTKVDNFFHIAGPLNQADKATRSGVQLEDIQEGSEWQDRETWPISREFRRYIPKVERQMKYYTKFSGIQTTTLSGLDEILHFSNSYEKVRGIMARFLVPSVNRDRGDITKDPTMKDYERADYTTGSQWRDGLSESRVKMLTGGMLNSAEFETLLFRAASVISDRPLGVRAKGEGKLPDAEQQSQRRV
jgi:hypothetical protein